MTEIPFSQFCKEMQDAGFMQTGSRTEGYTVRNADDVAKLVSRLQQATPLGDPLEIGRLAVTPDRHGYEIAIDDSGRADCVCLRRDEVETLAKHMMRWLAATSTPGPESYG